MLVQDLRFALRQLRKSPGFTLTVILTLALGIGANTAIVTLVHGILLRSLPVADPASLYRIGDTTDCCVEGGFQNDNGDFSIFSYDAYLHLKNSAPEFEQLAAVRAGSIQWSVRRGESQAKSLQGQFVSGNFFSTLGLGSYAGRVFSGSACRSGQLSRMAKRIQQRSIDCRLNYLHSSQAFHPRWNCAAGLLWRSRHARAT
jgi:hypothetical protein